MTIKCTKCGHEFEPTEQQRGFVERSKAKGMTFIALNCPQHHTMFYDPQTSAAPKPVKEVLIACPCKTCDGFVTRVEGRGHAPFWGCGECGQQWKTRQELDAAITRIIQKYPYRQQCYRRVGSTWEPVELHPDWLERYHEQIQGEWDDDRE